MEKVTRTYRIAFITPEYPTEAKTSGGLASFLGRLTHALQNAGHTLEIFVLSDRLPQITWRGDIKIHRVPVTHFIILRHIFQYSRAFFKLLGGIAEGPIYYLLAGSALSKAFKKQHAEKPFDIIHTSNLETSALFLTKQLRHNLVLRVNSKREVWTRADGTFGFRAWLVDIIETYMVKRVKHVYSGSVFLKKIYEKAMGSKVELVRPLLDLQACTTTKHFPIQETLPPRYFIHVSGKFGLRKGTDIIFKVLPKVRAECPDFAMIFVGRGDMPKEYIKDSRIRSLGPQPRPIVYSLLKGAAVSVFPSQAENLPNTVIESIMCETPVIGTNDSSIDELITPGENGMLVSQGDTDALAHAMVQAWKHGLSFSSNKTGIFASMDPATVVYNFISFATNTRPMRD